MSTVFITHPTSFVWNAASIGTWNGVLPTSSFSADGINLLAGSTYVSGSTISGSIGGLLYWNVIQVIFSQAPIPAYLGMRGGKAPGEGEYDASTAPLKWTRDGNNLNENQVRVTVSNIETMLSEDIKNFRKTAGLTLEAVESKQIVEKTEILVQTTNIKIK